MKEKLEYLWNKYKDLIPYIIFGVLTTIVNYVSYWIFAHPLGWSTVVSNMGAWILSVLFAYVTNRRWVFHSTASGTKEITKEFLSFLAARIGTGLMDTFIMWLCVDKLGWNDLIMKLASNVLVVILNYIFSKFFIFKKRDEKSAK